LRNTDSGIVRQGPEYMPPSAPMPGRKKFIVLLAELSGSGVLCERGELRPKAVGFAEGLVVMPPFLG
jgi:hypothetical protein